MHSALSHATPPLPAASIGLGGALVALVWLVISTIVIAISAVGSIFSGGVLFPMFAVAAYFYFRENRGRVGRIFGKLAVGMVSMVMGLLIMLAVLLFVAYIAIEYVVFPLLGLQ